MRGLRNVLVMFLFIVAGCTAAALAEDAGVQRGEDVRDVQLRFAGDLGIEAVVSDTSRYAVVPVEPLPVNEGGKVFVPQGSVETMTDAQVVVTLVRSYKLGEWMILALLATQVLIRLLKRKEFTNDLMPKYGTMIVLTLCAASAFLSAIVGGMNPVEAVLVFVLTGMPKFGHDMRNEWRRVNSQPTNDPEAHTS